jgi:regulator of sigma E protease
MSFLVLLITVNLLLGAHELGHLLAAKLLDVRVRRLSFGLGPPLFSLRLRGTQYVLRAIPLGAFLSMDEPPSSEELPALREALSRSAGVTLGGPLLNFIIALLALVIVHWSGTHVPVPMTIGRVEPGSRAAAAQLRPGDKVVTVDGQHISEWSELVAAVTSGPQVSRRLGILRSGEPLIVEVTPSLGAKGEVRLGVQEQYLFRESGPREAVAQAFRHVGRITQELASRVTKTAAEREDLSTLSPARSLLLRAGDAIEGRDRFLRMVAALSLGLALFYALPIPPLDGGKLLLVAAQAALGRRISTGAQVLAYAAGLALLLGLLAWVALLGA